MRTAPRILIFDSGVGGLSIVESIQLQHPGCSLIYASDNAAFPYGTKAESVLIERIDQVLHRIQEEAKADIIVVACNTASTLALPAIRECFELPIVGVVPAIKPAAQISQSKVIGLLATPGTIARTYTQDLVQQFARDCQVIPLGSSELVHLAEEYLRQVKGQVNAALPDEFNSRLQAIIEPYRELPNLDTVVLACTHFPLLREALQLQLPQVKHWVDSGEAIARRVGYWLDELKLQGTVHEQAEHFSLFTAKQESISSLSPALESRGLGDIRFLEIN